MEEVMDGTDHETAEEPYLATPRFSLPVDEKPLFHNSRRPPSTSVPYKLSSNGECIPYTINRYLRDYQRDGVRFIYNNYACSRGCILGDDMGLGKTIQVIAFLAAVLHKTGTWQDVENNVPHFLLSQKSSKQHRISKVVFLIVAPLSVLYNWKDELDTWGHFRTVVVHGTRKEEEFARVGRRRCEIALTTYETLRICIDQFNSINWSAVIVDEAHRIKKPSSQITQAMKQMKCKVRIGLTGTILQNNLEELWCVMDWANPGCLDSLEHFRNRFALPIERGQRRSTTKRALATGRDAVRQLSQRLARWFLRRTKALIYSQLPRKEDRVVFCSLSDFQQMVYRAVLDSEDVSLLLKSGERCCGSGRTRSKCCFKNNSKGVPVKDVYFSYLAILRKVANHVALLQPREGTSKKQEQYVNEICEKVFQKFPDFVQRCKQAAFEAMSDPMYSGKMKVLQKLLNHYMQSKDKVLLFSMSTKASFSLLDILESYCMATGIEYRRLDGNTKSKDRVKIVKEFNSSLDINICLVSTMAGGLGLNFVGANIVVLFDPTWNPASDLQAIDRAYRIGQYRDVTVLRLISLGTVEEIIYLRQVYKQQLQSAVVGKEHARRYFEAVQGPDGHSGELFGVRNLFRLQTEGTCLTQQILEREGHLKAGIMMARTAAVETSENSAEEPPREKLPKGEGNKASVAGAVGVLDFSSASEDEAGSSTRRKPMTSFKEAESGVWGPSSTGLSLLDHGFSKYLQEGPENCSGSEESSLDEEDIQTEGHPTPLTHLKQTVSNDFKGYVNQNKSENQRVSSVRENDPNNASEGFPGSVAVCRKLRGKRKKVSQGLDLGDPWRSGSSTDSFEHFERITEHHPDGVCKTERNAPETGEAGTSKSMGQKHCNNLNGTANNRRKRCRQGPFKAEDLDQTLARLDHTCLEDEGLLKTNASRADDHGVSEHKPSTTPGKTGPAAGKQWRSEDPVHRGKQHHVGSIDRLLDGMREVVHTHSNQRVVGSSKLEECISRAAMRDVFHYGRNSQAPASQLMGTIEISDSSEAEVRAPGHKVAKLQLHSVKHPVTQTLKTVHRTRNATFIIGETPSTIRRRQLEEMATFFKAASVQDFAEDLLKSTSDTRRGMLKNFYSSQNPALKAFLSRIHEDPVVAQPTSSTAAKQLQSPSSSSSSSRKQKINSVVAGTSSQSKSKTKEQRLDVTKQTLPNRDREQKCLNKHVVEIPKGSNCHVEATSEPVLLAGPSNSLCAKSVKPAPTIAPTQDLPVPLHGSRTLCGDENPPATTPSTASKVRIHQHLLSDLIGDTSILDDLFQRRPKTAQPTSQPASVHVDRSKRRCRDVWDILDEGNEECINKLTDVTQVDMICKKVTVATRAKNTENNDGTQLWRKNEKFLWKK
ncbi:DNA excision repair protein ERCC-6-like 2 isoform X1 [Arapaima gigas]